MLRGRTHRCQILGIGHQRSRGIKAGVVVDMEEAENAIRLAVDAAERMAGVQVEGVIVNMTGGRIGSQLYTAKIGVSGRAVSESDIHRVLEACSARTANQGRAVLHSLPTGYRLDNARGVRDPKGMFGDELGADMHVVSCDAAAARKPHGSDFCSGSRLTLCSAPRMRPLDPPQRKVLHTDASPDHTCCISIARTLLAL